MNNNDFITRTAPRRTMLGRIRRAGQMVLGLLTAVTLMSSAALASDVPDGWEVRGENNGVTFAPVRMNPGEKLEVWVANEQYEVSPGTSLPSQLPQIRQQAGAMEGDNCQPPEITPQGVTGQACMEGDTVLQYMLLPSPTGGNKVQLLRIRTAGGEEAMARYSAGFQQALQIVMQGQAQAMPRHVAQAQTAPPSEDRPEAQPQQAPASGLPDGWTARAENNGTTFAPVKMNPGEKFEVWVAGGQYDVSPGASSQSQLSQIRQQAGAMEGDNCQPPEVTDVGVVTQNCMEGDTALQYMLLPSPTGGNKVQLLRVRAAGSEEAMTRHSAGFQQILQSVMQAQAMPRRDTQTAPRIDVQTAPPSQSKPEAQPESARADGLPDGWTVRRGNKGVIFVPVKMNPGEKLEIWLADEWFKVQKDTSPQNRLLQIHQQAGVMDDGKCRPPEAVQNALATQHCQAGDAQADYMLLPTGISGNYVRLLRILATSDSVLERYQDGIRQTMKIAMDNNQAKTLLERQEQLERDNTARAIRVAPGQGVPDGDIAAVFVTEQIVQYPNETVRRVEHTTWLLLNDGTGYQCKIPPDELNVKVSQQLEPRRWVQWRKPWLGNGYEIRGQDDNDWHRLPTDSCMAQLVRPGEKCLSARGWMAQPARSGERLNGVYKHVDGWGSMYATLRVNTTTWHFSDDGTFKTSFQGNSGYVDTINHFSVSSSTTADSQGTRKTSGMSDTSGLWQPGGGGSVAAHSNRRVDDGASRQGHYRLKGWVLEVERDDGQTDRHFVTFPGDKRDEMGVDSTQFEGKRK